MNDMQKKVAAFNAMVGAVRGDTPAIRDGDLRVALALEETDEFLEAVRAGDLLEAVDAICDILYVTFGAADAFGVDIEPLFEIVHASNMRKVNGPTDLATGKRLKPPGWVPPTEELRAELVRQGGKGNK